ncbi:hypothetical protein [Pedobacter metabolipauper]|uniref:Type II secretion system protein GspC N-terminal domain-containing protein n=1 Tax=Pedobacter metabolipauper TaxID=425513 RepID=A0A4R6SZR7_9SPHI|nr:hypothetical protein [Pedobacter metabolipauper]TDQ11565.1 hypothetical protein ATK78_0688 [Pedobacter metabolipauper]
MEPVKNKKLTYLLICAVAAVWGIVLYRIFFNEPEEDYTIKNNTAKIEREPYDQFLVNNDTFKLAVNYRDPFLDKNYAAPEPVVKAATPSASNFNPPPMPGMVDWSSIKYSGYIVNPTTKKLVSIVIVNGREHMIEEGGTFDGLKLLKNKKDSILVSWQGQQKYIKQ